MTLVAPTDPNVALNLIMQLRLNGVFVPTWRGTVELSAYSVADTASFDTFIANAPVDYGKLSQTVSPCPFEVFIGQAGLISQQSVNQRVLYGLLEEEACNYEEDRIELRARGVLALLIDQRLTANIPWNQTVDKVISGIIQQYGLQAQVTPTSVVVGTILQADYVAMSRNYRAFEFITALADGLAWDVRVQGTTVIVGPPPTRGQVPEITKVWGNNAGEKLRVTHNALHSRNIKVIVKSYLSRTKSRTASLGLDPAEEEFLLGVGGPTPASTPKIAGPSGNQTGFTSVGGSYTGEVFTKHFPGLTAQQCDIKAAEIRDEITRHEFIVELTWSPTLEEVQKLVPAGCEWTLNLSGCSQRSANSSSAGVYYPKTVTWEWDSGETDSGDATGLTCTVLAYNHPQPAPVGGI